MANRKNVLLIVVDQWRGEAMPVLGHSCLRTPNLDALCADGVTFCNHFTQAAPCGPGRASLLTGQYMMNHRVVQNSVPLDARHTNLAFEVRTHGYQPALVGYMTSTPDPRVTAASDPRFKTLGANMPGWRSVGSWEPDKKPYFNWLRAKGYPVPERPLDIWLPQDDDAAPGATQSASRIPQELSDTTWATECALEYLRGPESDPWFLHLGYYRPHPPFIAPAPYNAHYDPAEVPAPVRAASPEHEAAQHPLLGHYVNDIEQLSFFENGQGRGADMSEDEVRMMRASYYGMISEIDDHLGRVIGHLKETGQYDDTLIILTSDHGEQLGDHHLLGKVGYFDESFHIPLVIRDPSSHADVSRGAIVDKFTGCIDVMPTILDWIGAETPRTCDGSSLAPFLHGETPTDWRTEIQFEFDFRTYFKNAHKTVLGLDIDRCSLAVIRDEKFKYVHFDALPPLFFDLENDPGQFNNVAEDPAYAARVLEYTQKMLNWRLHYAERTLTGYIATPDGLLDRRAG
ncbi:MAG: alkaline phosphatase family protein [Rhodospirillaceae bacterium]|jgi:arylsulfatase A-like enzyme|nr:alkaline phosphatase family protein [Rhodospirillaceae bacterium]MBT5812463.1 alkaline phosphatase family protein [Rhodospirillaceae bacterium]